MKIVPCFSLEGRTLLRRTHPKGYLSERMSKIAEKYERVYVTDTDGIERNRPQLDVAQEICDAIPTMYESGIRFGQNVIDVLVAGAENVVIGTATLVDLDELKRAFKLSENITFKADFRDGIVSFDPSIGGRPLLDISREIAEIGVSDLLVPRELAEDGARAKGELGLTLGVFASAADSSRLESLGVDYMVTEDYGSGDDNE